MKKCFISIYVLVCVAIISCYPLFVTGQQPRVLMCKGNPWELCDTDQWPTVYDNVDIVKIYIGDIKQGVDINQVKCFIQKLRSKGIKIAFEIGGLLDWHANKGGESAQYSFEQDWLNLQPFLTPESGGGAGGYIDMLDMDGPIRRMLFPNNVKANHHTLQTAVTELTKVIRMWQDSLPGVEVNVLVNFPVWGWKREPAYFAVDGYSDGYGNYYEVFNEMIRQFDSLNIHPAGITIDNPYDYAMGIAQTNQPQLINGIDWIARVLELEQMIKAENLKANLIFNSNLGGYIGNDSFHYHSLNYIDLYLQKGGNPDGYWMQSWYKHPQEWLPEYQPYTMTYLLLQTLNKIKGIPVTIDETNKPYFQLRYYPNPFTDVINILLTNPTNNTQDADIVIYDLLGRTVQQSKVKLFRGNTQFTFDMSRHVAGIYILELKTTDGVFKSTPIQKL